MDKQKQNKLEEIRDLALSSASELRNGRPMEELLAGGAQTYLKLLNLALDCEVALAGNTKPE